MVGAHGCAKQFFRLGQLGKGEGAGAEIEICHFGLLSVGVTRPTVQYDFLSMFSLEGKGCTGTGEWFLKISFLF